MTLPRGARVLWPPTHKRLARRLLYGGPPLSHEEYRALRAAMKGKRIEVYMGGRSVESAEVPEDPKEVE